MNKIVTNPRIFQFIVNEYGIDAQTNIAMEEAAELIQAINKVKRKKNEKSKKNLLEEIADTYICLAQLQEMFHFTDEELQNVIDQKISRQLQRIQSEQKQKIKDTLVGKIFWSIDRENDTIARIVVESVFDSPQIFVRPDGSFFSYEVKGKGELLKKSPDEEDIFIDCYFMLSDIGSNVFTSFSDAISNGMR